MATKVGYKIRETKGKYDSNPRFHVYRADGGKSIDNFDTRESAEAYRDNLITRDRQEAELTQRRETEKLAEEIRRAALTPEEREREDDLATLKSLYWTLDYNNENFVKAVRDVAAGLSYTAEQILQNADRYENYTEEHDFFSPDQLVNRLLDEMFFLPQRAREKYAVQESYRVAETFQKVVALRKKLGLSDWQGEGKPPRFPSAPDAATAE